VLVVLRQNSKSSLKVRDVSEGCVLRTAACGAEVMLVVSHFSNYSHRVLFAKRYESRYVRHSSYHVCCTVHQNALP